MLRLNSLNGFNSGGVTYPVITFLSFQEFNTNQTTHTFTFDLGSNANSKKFVFALSGEDSNITSVTLAGNNMSAVVAKVNQGSRGAGIWEITTTLTDSQNVVVTYAAAEDQGVGGAWIIENLASQTAVDTLSTTAANNTTISGNIDVSANGVMIAAVTQGDSLPGTNTWTGITERYEEATAVSHVGSGGDYTGPATAEANRSVSVVNTQTITDLILQAVSYR